MRISLEAEKFQMDWPMFVSRFGQRGDYAKQGKLENQIKDSVLKSGLHNKNNN